MHGGDNGELPHTKQFIFEHTYAQIQEHHKTTHYFIDSPQDDKSLICEVWQLFDLMLNRPNTKTTFVNSKSEINRKTFANLEVKVPYDKDVKAKYRWKECLKKLHDLIQKYQIAEHCMIQSFDHEAL